MLAPRKEGGVQRKAELTARRELPSQFAIDTWKPSDIPGINALEKQVWAPWLQKSPRTIDHIATHYADTQFVVRKGSKVVATLTTNRIDWDGNPGSLTTWDDVAGGPAADSNYATTYQLEGNTLCLMAASVDPEEQGEGLAPQLIQHVQEQASSLGVKYVISSFRPSGYGKYKLDHPEEPISFEEYTKLTRPDGKLLDPWLRIVSELGMEPLRPEPRAMVIDVSRAQFETYKKDYNPDKWEETPRGSGIWECGETGSWRVVADNATYVEPNLWGKVPLVH